MGTQFSILRTSASSELICVSQIARLLRKKSVKMGPILEFIGLFFTESLIMKIVVGSQRKKQKRGFTLVEIMIVMVII